jgi:DNA-binding transcriptional ArsR family regulator
VDALTLFDDVPPNAAEPVDALAAARARIEEVNRTGVWTPDVVLLADLVEFWNNTVTVAADRLNSDPGKVGALHPRTARRAAMVPRFGTQRWTILEQIVRSGPDGLTAAEIAERIEVTRNQVGSRLLELRECALVMRLRDTASEYVTRDTGTGCTGIVHVATGLGIELLRTDCA